MKSSSNGNTPRVVMIVSDLPPQPVGGAEIQGMKLCTRLIGKGVDVRIVTWGKFWQKRWANFKGLPYRRISGFINVPFDILTLLGRRKKKQTGATRIVYDDKKEVTDRMTRKVWIGMRIRYNLFFLNCLCYLWRRRKQFDIIHVNMMEWPAIVAVRIGKLLSKPVVIKDSTMNGVLNLLRYPNGEKKIEQIRRYAHCVAMTQMIETNYLKAGLNKEQITRIPNGIEIEPPPPSAGSWERSVIFVGNLTQQPAKGVDILLFAWRIVAEKVEGAQLNIVGDGDIRAYEQFSKELGIAASVKFLGKRSDIKELLHQSDIFVLPSRREGMSNALMEAMMAAKAIVATKVSGSEDLIENGKSGLLVDVANVEQLADALIYMLTNEPTARAMGTEAYRRIVDQCDMNEVSEKYIAVYRKLQKYGH